MDFKTLHEDWKTLAPGPFTEPEDEAVYKEFLKIKEQGDVHHHHYAKGDNPDDKKKREKDAKTKAKEGEAKADKPDSNGEAKANGNGEEKPKLDPVGKEDGDIDNDGDKDKADKYLAKKRKAIGKSIKAQKKTKTEKPIKLSGSKEKVELHKGVEEASTYMDKSREDEKKKAHKKKYGREKFAFGQKNKSRWGQSGYSKGEEAEHDEPKLDEGEKDKKKISLGFSFADKVKKYNKKLQKTKDDIEKYKKEDAEINELSPELMKRAWQGATKKASMAGRQRVADRGDKEAAADHAKRRKQSSKFFNKYIKTQEDTEVDEMSAIKRTALNIHNQRVKLGITKPGTKKSKESGVQKKAKPTHTYAKAMPFLYNDNSMVDEAPSDYEDEIKKFKAGGGKVKKLKPGKKFASLFKQKGPKKPPRQAEETENVEEGTGLAVKMALDDAGVKGHFDGKNVKVHKKHIDKAKKALKGNVYHRGKTPSVVGEEAELDEAAIKGKLRDLSQELVAYAKKHRSSIDKPYFEKIAQIAAAGKMPSAKDIDTDTEPRDVVLGMMAKSFPSGVMKSFKGVSPALDRSLSKGGGLFYARHGEEVEHEGDMTEDLKAIDKEIDKLHSRTKHMKYLTGKDRDAMRALSRKRDAALKGRKFEEVELEERKLQIKRDIEHLRDINSKKSLTAKEKEQKKQYLKKHGNDPMDWSRKIAPLKFEEVELDELVAPGKKSASGYTLYHKTFSDAMQHAVDHAKTKGAIVDPKEIDDKVATGPRKPSSGKTNRYSLGAGRKTVQIQVANLDNKAYELNMYIEGVQLEEDFKTRISNNPMVNKLYLMNQAKAIAKEKAGPDKEHKISAWEDLAKKMGFDRRDYEEFGEHQGMYESSIPQEKGDMATKTRLKLEKVLENRKKPIEPKESERAGEWGTDKLSDNYKEATPGQEVKEGNVIVNDRDPYRVFEQMVHYLMGTSVKNIEDYSFYKIEETPDKLRLENKEGALATITLADVQSFYDDQDMGMDEFVEMIVGFGVKELTEKENSVIGDEGTPAIGKDKGGQGIYTTDPPKTFESHVDVYSKYIQSNEQRQKKGFVVN